ncbi:hypothetical protein EHO61_00865 [Leptospira fluminis]|uniref:Uncharacterized protein n=1 Tax=Leptospira fluminis TaxID=2484979 RepID=A0A4R9GTT3_9LEPT|nr:hypothetical protein [Leptospira fluminis]TGK22364.1 hypothetical protein EHO61_00865 [Leptospira fluminis]
MNLSEGGDYTEKKSGISDPERDSPYLTFPDESLSEEPILSIKGISFIPVYVCPKCRKTVSVLWKKGRGRLRDWATFREEVRTILCTNEDCRNTFLPDYAIRFSASIPILSKLELLNEMKSWFYDRTGKSVDFGPDVRPSLTWDPFSELVPDWQDHISLELFANILRYTPPIDLEAVLLGRPKVLLFGGYSPPTYR